MKKLIFLFAMVFAVSMAQAQVTVDLDQSGNVAYWATNLINNASIQQTGTNVNATLVQVAGTYNSLTDNQNGTNLFLNYHANAGAQNFAGDANTTGFEQSGINGHIDVTQVATTLGNNANTRQLSGLAYIAMNNDIDVTQTAGTFNNLTQTQYGQNHKINLVQTAGTSNSATISQGEWTPLEINNKLVGASLGIWGPSYDNIGPATQISGTSSNVLNLTQTGNNNQVGLYQNGNDYNLANMVQTGDDNSLLIYQTNVNGYNSVISNQVGGNNSASVFQNAISGSGTITVDQN
jgi:hypothetical protein